MRICYVDEAGCTGALPSATSEIQPVFVICGVDLPQDCIGNLTHEFLHLKQRFFPRLARPESKYMEWILTEIKGAELRRRAVADSHRKRRHSLGFIHETISLLEKNDARLYGRVWVKGIGLPINGRSIYTYSLQYICQCFNRLLATRDTSGLLICDSRNKELNSAVSHSIFTQKFRARGDSLPHILEMPVFGHSENHAGVQIADLMCSALLFPLAIQAYCRNRIRNVHVRDYSRLCDEFTPRLVAMQERYPAPADLRPGRESGGIVVDDKLSRRPRSVMFPEPLPDRADNVAA